MADTTHLFFESEGAVLRAEDEVATGLAVYHPGKGWVPYADTLDWMNNSQPISPEDAKRLVAQDDPNGDINSPTTGGSSGDGTEVPPETVAAFL